MYGGRIVSTSGRHHGANRLRRLREAQGLSQQELADRITSSYGPCETVHKRTVDRWERGTIPGRHWPQLAELFGVSVSHLLGLDGPDGDNGDDGIRRVA